jgi:hypothetical protein
MSQIPFIFNQLVNFIPKDSFDRLVAKFNGNAHVKHYSCWNHLLTMIWAQLTSRRSLRDIESSLRAHSDKLYRMGIGNNISRNNISNANANRNVSIYRELAQLMMERASHISIKDDLLQKIGETFHINGFFAIDSSTILLDLSKFSWSTPQVGYGGVKMHTMFDVLRNVPRLCLITGHEERDQTFMEDYPYESGCFYMLDRLFLKTIGLNKINSIGAYFVTRMKKNVCYEVIADTLIDGNRVLSDQIIKFSSRWAAQGYPSNLRLIRFYSIEKEETLSFITNNFILDPATIAILYKYRWQIELFFRWIKQHLRIINFYGCSSNAVMIQIYTAFTAYCALALAADSLKFEGSLYEFANLISVSLTERTWLPDLLSRYEINTPPTPEDTYPSLFDF